MSMLLQYYEDGTFGYKGIDDCYNNTLLKQIKHEVLFEQNLDEDREDFFKRANKVPEKNEYGSDEKLDVEINSKDWDVREDVAYQGYGLNRLINDSDEDVRVAVADQGYELEKLINDKHWKVRASVAWRSGKLGREDLLEKLMNDKHWKVRRNVAQEFGDLGRKDLLEEMITDSDERVRNTVQHYILN